MEACVDLIQEKISQVLSQCRVPKGSPNGGQFAECGAGIAGGSSGGLKPDTLFWSKERLEREIHISTYPGGRSKASLAWVDTTRFVQVNTASDGSYYNIFKEAGPLDIPRMAAEQQSPYLQVSATSDGGWKITGHEGRHRMAALASAGIKKAPIVLDWETAEKRGREGFVRLLSEFDSRVPIVVSKVIPLHREYLADLMEEFGGKSNVE